MNCDHRTNCDWCFWYKGLLKGLEDFEILGGRVKTIQPVEHESDDRTIVIGAFGIKDY